MLATVVQFYFDRFLPADDSWPEMFELLVSDRRAQVRPRLAGQPLFPESIDQTLSNMELVLAPVSRPGGMIRTRVQDRVIDRLQVTVINEMRTPGPMEVSDAAIDETFEAAVRAADIVIGHCRILAQSPSLRGVQREYRREDQRLYFLDPYSISWFGGEDPSALRPLPVYAGEVNASAYSGALRAPETGTVTFAALSEAFRLHGAEPPIAEALLVTGEERLTQMWVREALVAVVAAIEIASDAFIDAHPSTTSVDDILRSRDSFASKRLDRVPEYLVQRSFKTDDPGRFDLVERAYRARNNISHRGRLEYKDHAGTVVSVDQHEVRDFIAGARTAVNWLTAMTPGPETTT